MSRRGAVKVNPVTGKMVKMSEEEAGGHRDGCLKLDEKYINAAKDLGLGGAEGTLVFGNSYFHLLRATAYWIATVAATEQRLVVGMFIRDPRL
jgi:hypothetical protein